MYHITENYGHPWTRQEGWDLLEIKEDTEEKLDAQIAIWKKEMWKIWIRDDTGRMVAVMYKPHGVVSMDWKDPIDEK